MFPLFFLGFENCELLGFRRKAEWAVLDRRRPRETVRLLTLVFSLLLFAEFLFGSWENRRENWKLMEQWQHI